MQLRKVTKRRSSVSFRSAVRRPLRCPQSPPDPLEYVPGPQGQHALPLAAPAVADAASKTVPDQRAATRHSAPRTLSASAGRPPGSASRLSPRTSSRDSRAAAAGPPAARTQFLLVLGLQPGSLLFQSIIPHAVFSLPRVPHPRRWSRSRAGRAGRRPRWSRLQAPTDRE